MLTKRLNLQLITTIRCIFIVTNVNREEDMEDVSVFQSVDKFTTKSLIQPGFFFFLDDVS